MDENEHYHPMMNMNQLNQIYQKRLLHLLNQLLPNVMLQNQLHLMILANHGLLLHLEELELELKPVMLKFKHDVLLVKFE